MENFLKILGKNVVRSPILEVVLGKKLFPESLSPFLFSVIKEEKRIGEIAVFLDNMFYLFLTGNYPTGTQQLFIKFKSYKESQKDPLNQLIWDLSTDIYFKIQEITINLSVVDKNVLFIYNYLNNYKLSEIENFIDGEYKEIFNRITRGIPNKKLKVNVSMEMYSHLLNKKLEFLNQEIPLLVDIYSRFPSFNIVIQNIKIKIMNSVFNWYIDQERK